MLATTETTATFRAVAFLHFVMQAIERTNPVDRDKSARTMIQFYDGVMVLYGVIWAATILSSLDHHEQQLDKLRESLDRLVPLRNSGNLFGDIGALNFDHTALISELRAALRGPTPDWPSIRNIALECYEACLIEQARLPIPVIWSTANG